MEPWYKVAAPRKEVREGRSFNPDEFAIALEQVVAGTAPEDYRDPAQFLGRKGKTTVELSDEAIKAHRLEATTSKEKRLLDAMPLAVPR